MAMILLPLAMALLLLWAPARPLVIRGLGLAPAPALLLLPAAWDGGVSSFTLAGGWTYVLDRPGALMLAASTLLWIIGGLAASRWLVGRTGQTRFSLWWLLTLSGSLGVFVAGDAVSFYALYALASLPAYGLIAFSGSEEDRTAGRITLAAALLGEGLILAAIVLLAIGAAGQGLAIASLLHALPNAPHCGLVITLVVIGFGLKIGLVPLHGWMPTSYASGPLVATAVLSGATSKAGLIGLIRFLPLDQAMPVAGGLIIAAGLFSAFYGAVLGLTQDNPRSVLAYSSISQLGQMAAALGAGLAGGLPGAGTLVAFYAAYHVLTKGGLFLLLAVQRESVISRWGLILPGFMALGFAGLPLTGGALGKLALKDVVGSGATGVLFSLAAIGSTVLMLHFLRLVKTAAAQPAAAPLPRSAWIVTAMAATLLQWSLYGTVTGVPAGGALRPGLVLELLWPVAAGLLLAWALAAARIPRLAPGDFSAQAITRLGRWATSLADAATALEMRVRPWQVPSLCLAIALAGFVLLQL
jgi:formate hydrogenlyase subunit 3/multisubunit Na+/H+ antiporter MnhD subunit